MRYFISGIRLALGLLALLLVNGPEAVRAQDAELALGSQLPVSALSRQSGDGGSRSLSALRGERGTVVLFWSNECPWSGKYEDRLSALASTYGSQGFSFVLVNSNDPVAFPKEASPEAVRHASSLGAVYLMDADGQLARAFGAARTPHVYLFDPAGVLVYAGTIDDSPGDPGNAQAHYLRNALDAVSRGVEVSVPRTKAFGCTVKLQGGN